jgi:hypothetical protein
LRFPLADIKCQQQLQSGGWILEGEKHIGTVVRRIYPGIGAIYGRVIAYFPSSGGGTCDAVWRVIYDDGDVEDLTADEMELAIMPVHPESGIETDDGTDDSSSVAVSAFAPAPAPAVPASAGSATPAPTPVAGAGATVVAAAAPAAAPAPAPAPAASTNRQMWPQETFDMLQETPPVNKPALNPAKRRWLFSGTI